MVRSSTRKCGPATLNRVNPRRCILTHMGFTAAIRKEARLDRINHGSTSHDWLTLEFWTPFEASLKTFRLVLCPGYAHCQESQRYCAAILIMKPRFPAFHCGFWGLQASKATPPSNSLCCRMSTCQVSNAAVIIVGSTFIYSTAVGITPRMIYVRTFKALCRKSFHALLLVVEIEAGNLFFSS